jgi:hypothetical protein
MANFLKEQREKYHIFRSPFIVCDCRSPKYLFSSGDCEGCLKKERQFLIYAFRDLVCAHPDIPYRTQESLWQTAIVPYLTKATISFPAIVSAARIGTLNKGE